MADRSYNVVIRDTTGMEKLFEITVLAGSKERAVIAMKRRMAGLSWKEALAYAKWTDIKKETYAEADMCEQVHADAAEKKFRYEITVNHKEGARPGRKRTMEKKRGYYDSFTVEELLEKKAQGMGAVIEGGHITGFVIDEPKGLMKNGLPYQQIQRG